MPMANRHNTSYDHVFWLLLDKGIQQNSKYQQNAMVENRGVGNEDSPPMIVSMPKP